MTMNDQRPLAMGTLLTYAHRASNIGEIPVAETHEVSCPGMLSLVHTIETPCLDASLLPQMQEALRFSTFSYAPV